MEAIIMFVNAVAEIFVFPIPLALHRVYELWMIAIHVGGHCGFEMFPFIPHMGQLLWVLSGIKVFPIINMYYRSDFMVGRGKVAVR